MYNFIDFPQLIIGCIVSFLLGAILGLFIVRGNPLQPGRCKAYGEIMNVEVKEVPSEYSGLSDCYQGTTKINNKLKDF